MVGVPGRSKACSSCRRRSKGCDLQRPACGPCLKVGIECGGYEKHRVFVVSTQESRRSVYKANLRPNCEPVLENVNPSPGGPIAFTNDSIISQPLIRSAHEGRTLDLFWEAYFTNGAPPPPSIFRSYTCGWTEVARRHYKDDDCLRFALWANCLGNLSLRDDGELWVREEGLKMYGMALKELQKSLQIPERAKRDSLLAAVKLLSTFEVFFNSHTSRTNVYRSGWDQHVAGELALFVARTPTAHVHGDAHHMFADERIHLLFPAIKRRKRSVLSSAEWKTIPWEKTRKNLKDILFDVVVEMPGLLEDFEALTRYTHEDNNLSLLKEHLINKCWNCDRQLLQWMSVLGIEAQFCDYPVPVADSQISVAEFARLEGMSLLWATCLTLYSILRSLCFDEIDLPARTDPRQYIHKLLGVIPVLLRPDAGLYGQSSVVLPLALSLVSTAGKSMFLAEQELLMANLGRIKGHVGIELLEMVDAATSLSRQAS